MNRDQALLLTGVAIGIVLLITGQRVIKKAQNAVEKVNYRPQSTKTKRPPVLTDCPYEVIRIETIV